VIIHGVFSRVALISMRPSGVEDNRRLFLFQTKDCHATWLITLFSTRTLTVSRYLMRFTPDRLTVSHDDVQGYHTIVDRIVYRKVSDVERRSWKRKDRVSGNDLPTEKLLTEPSQRRSSLSPGHRVSLVPKFEVRWKPVRQTDRCLSTLPERDGNRPKQIISATPKTHRFECKR